LRIVIITQDDPFYVYEFFDRFFNDPRLPDVADIAQVLIQPGFNESLPKLVKRMLGFWGPVNFLRIGFTFLACKISNHCVRRLAEDAGLKCTVENNVNSPECLEALEKHRPDVILSVAAPQIFRDKLLALPTWGCINVHSGPLPEYRGMLPTFWQMLHKEPQIGITVHTMAKDIDAGQILNQQYTPMEQNETLDSVIRRTKRIAARLVLDTLCDIRDANVSKKPMDISQGSYFSFPKSHDVRRFKKIGCKRI